LPVFLRPLDAESASQYARESLGFEALDLNEFRLHKLKRLLQFVHQHRIAIIHWNFYHPLLNPYLWFVTVLRPRIEHYFTDHISRPTEGFPSSGSRGLKSMLKGSMMGRYRRIVCVSDFVLSQWQGISKANSQRIYYFINVERFRPDASVRRSIRHEMGISEEFVVLCVAHLIREKGVDVALRALAELPGEVQLWIVGRGEEQDSLEQLARELELGSRVRFLGPKRFVEPFMQAADCLICPSIWAEAAGLVNLEALACSLPVVASRVGGIPEFIEHGRNGFLFSPGDQHELAERIERLFHDEQTRQRLGRQARSDVVEGFSLKSLLDQHLSLYQTDAS
jgi:glycosyltransferase involved in cell wall biosynthesis